MFFIVWFVKVYRFIELFKCYNVCNFILESREVRKRVMCWELRGEKI